MINGTTPYVPIGGVLSTGSLASYQLGHLTHGIHIITATSPSAEDFHRLFSRARLALVEAASPMVDGVLPCPSVLHMLVPQQPAVIPKQAIADHGHLLVLFVHGKPAGRLRPTWPAGPGRGCWVLRHRHSGQSLLPHCARDGLHVDGYWGPLSSTGA